MAKGKGKDSKKSKGGASEALAEGAAPVAKAARVARDKAADLLSNPVVAEIVAATLVAAAAALRDPKKAREIAEQAGEGIGTAVKGARDQGGALWQLAMDVATRSIDALGGSGQTRKAAKRPEKPEKPVKPAKPVPPEKPAKPPKPAKPEKPAKPDKPAKADKPAKSGKSKAKTKAKR